MRINGWLLSADEKDEDEDTATNFPTRGSDALKESFVHTSVNILTIRQFRSKAENTIIKI